MAKPVFPYPVIDKPCAGWGNGISLPSLRQDDYGAEYDGDGYGSSEGFLRGPTAQWLYWQRYWDKLATNQRRGTVIWPKIITTL